MNNRFGMFFAGASNGAAFVWLGGFNFDRRCPELSMALTFSVACGVVFIVLFCKTGDQT